MISYEAQCLLDRVISDYMYIRGFHDIGDAFIRETFANPNSEAANSPQKAFLQTWWGKFYKAYNSRFPNDSMFIGESFDKVELTVEDVVANNVHANQTSISEYTCVNISNVMPVMPSPHLMASSHVMESSDPANMDAALSDLVSKDTLDLSPFEMNGMDDMLPFASNVGYQMSTVPLECNSRDDRHDINLGRPTLMQPNAFPANALPTSRELLDAGNNRSLQQAYHQGWPSIEQFLRITSFPQQDVLPNVAIPPLDKLKFTPISIGDFFQSFTQGESSGKDAGVLGDTNERTSENLPPDQQIIAPIGGLMQIYGNQPALQIGQKRKTPSSSLASVEKGKAIVTGIANDNTKSAGALTERAKQEGISFKEICNFHATNIKLRCCHFDSQGEFLATAGDNRKVLIWGFKNNNISSREGHILDVTDIRFSPNSTMFATSSLDRTVKIWDAAKPSNTFRNLVGHDEHVMSVDFHPTKMSLLSSCDRNDEIRLWDVNRRDCRLILKGGGRQVRFQPRLGHLLASFTKNIINIFDIETNNIHKKLQGHVKDIRSICWDFCGNNLASVSEDSARIWSIKEGKCIFELFSSENKFRSCTFHPSFPLVLVIGSDEFIELWHPISPSNRSWSYSAHNGIISSLAASTEKGIITSVSHDEWIKIWR